MENLSCGKETITVNKTTEGKDKPIGWTSLEQSKRLVECGLDAKTADMYYEEMTDSYGERLYKWNLFVGKSAAIEKNLFSYRLGYTVPCWSLGKLYSLMPDKIKKDGFEKPFRIGMFKGFDKFWCQYFATDSGGALVETTGENATESVVEMIVWLLKNGYLTKTEENEQTKTMP